MLFSISSSILTKGISPSEHHKTNHTPQNNQNTSTMSAFLSALNDPVFRALIDGHQSQAQSQATQKTFAPNFDIQETATEYILEGELPGLSDKRAINIEFTDGQTVAIAGRVERPAPTQTPETTEGETPAPAANVESEKPAEDSEKSASDETDIQRKKESATLSKQPKVWVSERSVGSFRRVFRFPTTVDTDNVKATLEHGILLIVVPKRTVQKRRVEIE